jgi:hypothetical protein
MLDIPGYQLQIEKTFGSNVVWEYDQGESLELRRLSEGFYLKDLSYEKEDFGKTNVEFSRLKTYLTDSNGDVQRS